MKERLRWKNLDVAYSLMLRIIAADRQGCSTLTQLETVATGYIHLISLHLSKSVSASNQLRSGILPSYTAKTDSLCLDSQIRKISDMMLHIQVWIKRCLSWNQLHFHLLSLVPTSILSSRFLFAFKQNGLQESSSVMSKTYISLPIFRSGLGL